MTTTIAPLFQRLDEVIDRRWEVVAGTGLWRHVAEHGFDPQLYRDLMVQVFHYSRFNSINQALTVAAATPEQRALLRFVYRHADEELGHEQLVVHDLRAVGLVGEDDDLTSFPRLPATDALIGYLAGVAINEGPVARLGYSYWAEDVYGHLAPLLTAAKRSLQLTEREMTFFVAHAGLDARHSDEVRRVLARVAVSVADHDAVVRVADTTLWLTTQLMQQTFERWKAA